ncbi:hypothetical protein HYPSUDRAFT_212134 [Hypholoma sublateritium FD-334 SS-4]|uniref:Uncharacterized protein n=1 Tax=Hypholoma sublateritium (strain FD-334 SS-4) TaxID=945553 RepID=A0A0D2LKD8_HYPSF|nr:hypothetical protein HYPSUDRAFT_212134 [Hypholoma sublateritium FD-334 SS-4]
MNPSEAFLFPSSYYQDIAFFCSNYMTRIFSRGLIIFMFDENDGWQGKLRSFIESILFKSHSDDSVAIGAMVLLEAFRNGPHPRPAYPHPDYLEYFLGAYISAHHYLSRRPMRHGFWKDVVDDLYTECELQRIEKTFASRLGGRVHIGQSGYLDMKKLMYGFVRTHMDLRSGGSYVRNRSSEPRDLPPWRMSNVGRRGTLTHTTS